MKFFKYIIIHKILFIFSVLPVLLAACAEETKDPCAESSNIEIEVVGKNVEICEGLSQEFPASEAQVIIIHYNEDKSEADTLVNRFLDTNGKLQYVIPNSQCGINNIKLVAVNNSFYYEDEIDFMCCDTSYVFEFERNCEETTETQIDCESFTSNIDVNLANQYGGCLMVGAGQDDIRWNSTSINTDDEITVDVSSVVDLKDKFYANVSPLPDVNGEVVINEQTSLNISFFVETSEVGEFNTSLVLPTTCSDGSGNENFGEITINVSAEICEDGCACPFSNNGEINKTIDYSGYPVSVGSSVDYGNEPIFTIRDGMLDNECYIIVTAVNRLNSTDAATLISAANEAQHDWIITDPLEYGQQIRLNESFFMAVQFTPEKSGESADTFEIMVDVYNRIDELKESCSFIVEYKGEGCENICPEITKMNSLAADLTDASTGAVIQKLNWGETISMTTTNNIAQSMSGNLGNICRGIITGSESVSYLVNVPDTGNLMACSSVYFEYSISDDGVAGDRLFFEVQDNFAALSAGENGLFNIYFNTPNIQSHIQSGHDAHYRAELLVDAKTSTGELICSQIIKLDAEVYQNTVNISEPMSMKAFSQISDKETEPAYQVYKIDTYSDDYHYFGRIDNLDFNHIDFTSAPNAPLSNHSFYFEVEDPENTALRQIPKLFLVNDDGTLNPNSFTHISENPIANYSSNSDFAAGMDNLINHVFQSGAFNSLGEAPYYSFQFENTDTSYGWTPARTAGQMASDGVGVEIKLGDVFVIWNPVGNWGSFDANGNTYSSYCDVAFLYIDGISDGANTNHHVGFVSFYVAYPLSVIQN
ncbi:MAG: hypothetical protein JXR50_10705 [Prolixibacteraceae bacterium]|nr:hypothetical protein [Prolixibacteraceae bacterium]MBN2650196.1 hypothetical protein [Prolixibacteraceae bacterium]